MSSSLKRRMDRLETRIKQQCPPEFKIVIHDHDLADRYESEGCEVLHVIFIKPDGTEAEIP